MNALRNLIKPEKKTLGAKVTRNVIFNGVKLVLLAPLPFVIIPYFLKKLGTSGYGTWAVFLAISGVTSLADVGLATALSKHVAEFHARRDFIGLSRILNTGFALYLGIDCVLIGVLWFSASFLLRTLFKTSSVSHTQLQQLWHLLLLLIFPNVLSLLFSSSVMGMQRMDLTSGISSLNLLLSAGLSIFALSKNWGLYGVLGGYVVAAWIALGMYVFVLHLLLPEIKASLKDCCLSVSKEILTFSVKTYVTQVAVVIHNQIEKLYLAQFVGVVQVGWYDISSDLALKFRGIPSVILSPVMPAASELHALRDQTRLRDLYFRAHKYLAFIGVPFVVYIAFISRQFVSLWVGPLLDILAIPLSVLLIVNFFNLTTGPGLLTLVAGNKLKPGLYSALLGMAMNVTLSFVLIRGYGFHGAIIGTSVSLCAASAFFLVLFRREMGSAFYGVMRSAYGKPLACSLLAVGFLWMLMHSYQPSWIKLAIGCVVFGFFYLVLMLFSRYFDSFDLAIVERYCHIPQIARRVIFQC